MAEARAIAKSFDHTHLRGVNTDFAMVNLRAQSFQFALREEGYVIFIPGKKYLRKMVVRRLFEFKINLESLLYPVTLPIAAAITCVFSAWMVLNPSQSWWRSNSLSGLAWYMDEYLNPFKTYMHQNTRVAYLSFGVAFIGVFIIMWIHRLILRILLSYQGWLSDPPGKASTLTKIWAVLLKFLFFGGRSQHTYAYQRALPSLPVPNVETTIAKYLKSTEPTVNEAEFENVKKLAAEFLKHKDLWKITQLLKLKSHLYTNYVSDWWLKYVYLRGRSSILINSNYYGLGFAFDGACPTSKQTARAGTLVYYFLKFKEMLDRETLETTFMRGLIPICMEQYKYMFSTTRIPLKTCDELYQYGKGQSRHICVTYKGLYYRVDIYHSETNRLLTGPEFEAQFSYIIKTTDELLKDESQAPSLIERQIGALTTENRTKWAEVRECEFSEGINRLSLDIIESAVFIVDLETLAPKGNIENKDWSDAARCQLHGDGTNRWVDKSFTLIVYANGKCGLHVEHSWGDAPAIAHAFEWVTVHELNEIQYDHGGNFLMELSDKDMGKLMVPTRIKWNLDKIVLQSIEEAVIRAQSDIDDLQLKVTLHDAFGKGIIKKCRVSPDSFIQLSLQLAFYRSQGYCPLTYESCMTRLFRDGRTETIRSCTSDSKTFVCAFDDANITDEEKYKLLSKASKVHSENSKDAMLGKGIDRHLFAMYVAAMGINIEMPFLQDALSRTWRLSTSQIPQRQTQGLWKNDDPKYYSPSGGFGPVDDEGYGVSYMIAGEDYIFFHVSCKKKCQKTNSELFLKEIFKALYDMKDLCLKVNK